MPFTAPPRGRSFALGAAKAVARQCRAAGSKLTTIDEAVNRRTATFDCCLSAARPGFLSWRNPDAGSRPRRPNRPLIFPRFPGRLIARDNIDMPFSANPMNSNPFVNQAPSRTPAPQRPGGEWGAGLAEALSEANGPARRRAAARRDAKSHAACQAWLLERERAQPAAPSAELAAWTQAGDGSCPILGPVARWLRERGQATPIPAAARDRAEFVDRLDVLVRLADDLATRAQSLADGAIADYAALDARADRCMSIAVAVRQAVWVARLEAERSRLLLAAVGVTSAIVSLLEAFCAPR